MLSKEELETVKALEDGLTAYSALHDKLSDHFDADVKGSQDLKDFVNIASLQVASSLIISKLEETAKNLDLTKARHSDKTFQFEIFQKSRAETLDYLTQLYSKAVDAKFDNSQNIIRDGTDLLSISKEIFETLNEKCQKRKEDYPGLVTKIRGLNFELFGKTVEPFTTIAKTVMDVPETTFEDIVGNTQLISMLKTLGDNILAYDPKTKKNPILDVFDFSTTILLYGDPGTGKTATLQAFLNYLQTKAGTYKKTVKHVNIGNDIKSKYFGDSVQNLKSKLEEATRGDSICVVTIEDIDAIFSAREELKDRPEEKAILQELMNILEGIASKKLGNFILIATSNRPANLDDALGERLKENQLEVTGPETAQDYTGLFQIKMKKGIKNSYVEVDGESWKKIGETCLSYKKDYQFSGRAIKNITKKLMTNASMFQKPEEIYTLSHEEAVEKLRKNKNLAKIDGNKILTEIEVYKNEGVKQEGRREMEKKKEMIEGIVQQIEYEKLITSLPGDYKTKTSEEVRISLTHLLKP